MLDRAGIERDSVTLVLDKGSSALANTLRLQRHGLHWVAALPWNQAPQRLRSRPLRKLESLEPQQPGLKACAQQAQPARATEVGILSP